MNSIIRPEEFPQATIEPITKKYWNEFDHVVVFELDVGQIVRFGKINIDTSVFSTMTSEQMMQLVHFKRVQEYLEKNYDPKDFKTRVSWGRYKYGGPFSRNPPKMIAPPVLSVFLKSTDAVRDVISKSGLSVTTIKALTSEKHTEQLANTSGVDSVDLRKQNYWGTYNIKVSLPIQLSRHVPKDLSRDMIEMSSDYRRLDNHWYLRVDDEDLDQLAFFRLTHGDDVLQITKVEIIQQ